VDLLDWFLIGETLALVAFVGFAWIKGNRDRREK